MNIERFNENFYLTNEEGYGFDLTSNGYPFFDPSGEIYVNVNYVQNITEGTEIFYGVNVSISNTKGVFVFPVKTPEQEQIDNNNALRSDYEPSYFYETSNVFFVPMEAYYQDICNKYVNGALLSYTYGSISDVNYFSTLDYCLNKGTMSPCMYGDHCGLNNCLGPCDTKTCIPKNGEAECGTYETEKRFKVWKIILILVAIIAVLVVLIFLMLKISKLGFMPKYVYNYVDEPSLTEDVIKK